MQNGDAAPQKGLSRNTKNLVLIYVRLKKAENNDPVVMAPVEAAPVGPFIGESAQICALFAPCAPACQRLGAGVFIADENLCYPAILKVIALCDTQKLALAIVPIGQAPLTLSREYGDLAKWLKGIGQDHRLTEFPPQPQPTKP
jgi:hypothetical protein